MSQASHPPRPRVLVLSHDVISHNMAGPGIRSLEVARVLAEHFEVTLAMPNECDLEGEPFRLHPYRYGDWDLLQGAFEGVDVAFMSGFSLHEFPAIVKMSLPIVVDLYDPFPLENLYIFEGADAAHKGLVHLTDSRIVDVMCRRGDFFVCANPRQRDWWLGVLQGKGRINPPTVEAGPSLRALIDELPFGLPLQSFAPAHQAGPKHTVPGLTPDDRLILWGGGLWNWLDPLTLIRAMPAVLAQEPRARLLFPGTRHPNQAVPEMRRTQEAIELADELGLLDKAIFFGGWVPYEQWPDVLADADVAVSLHFDTLETQFSAVRSRVLSYIWACLPMVVTTGDAASGMVAAHQLGEVVGYEQVEAVSTALLNVLATGKRAYADNFAELARELTWHQVAQPLLDFCSDPQRAPDHAPTWVAAQRALGGPSAEEQIASQQNHIQHQTWHIEYQTRVIEELQAQVAAYEGGRFMTLMRQLHRLRARVLP